MKKLAILLIVLVWSCCPEEQEIDCGCVKTIYQIKPMSAEIGRIVSTENVFCQPEVQREFVTNMFYFNIECN